ncbi:putative Holliday junction resolvase [Curtobacterium sp. PhB142]|uniref:Holliday junction resolvase RuvX n=1 Tax=Sphingomonas sp. LR61 TaxID=3050234 RepID=UPI000FB47A6F|nr:putative Holliday junction resolvase [Curtobacterium sp. PhB171]ROQ23889.1 putative Holliday junction resolvase [Curtobacterium sp. PhB170]ROS35803.1 putative Holliday junction resolvase [Curtobacterium sp. PhB131]ROS69912.1 putative Holliday junction resolvase [Curtobacterium sp. PhB141]TCL80800.1 putative Holliday junction resolvase [Curtobacterium sp. PhB128]TCL84248.1 putative Holliday junction resolvase [Curtobacterium sp. PhB142]TCL98925.1 putative Holliday junction resolvase [Curtob
MAIRSGRRLGVDVGRARIGIAVCDRDGLLATPVETVRRDDSTDLRRILEIADEYDVLELVVGLPLSMSGGDTPSTDDARAFAARIAERRPVRLVDERLSTVTAQRGLHQAGKNTKKSRSVIDQAAAVIILQHALDHERSAGAPPGTTLP